MPHKTTRPDFAKASILALALILLCLCIGNAGPAQQPDAAEVIRLVDTAVRYRVENVLGFTDIEHYTVYRGKDETHPVAELTARDTYKKGVGKSYTVLSQSGSAVVQKFGLRPLLDNEAILNKPGNVEQSWFTSANYDMQLKPEGIRKENGRDCYTILIRARRSAPNMVNGTLWVDAKDGSIVQIEGVASKSPSPFAGTTHMMRQYSQIEGFPMATHARAESSSLLFGRTLILIEYSDYHLEVQTASGTPSAAKP
jgi:hypothetical protein